MQELSTEEMTSLRGGLNFVTALSIGNIAIAMPIDINVLSGIGSVSQIAGAKSGTQKLKFLS
jgi:hypothetical protein